MKHLNVNRLSRQLKKPTQDPDAPATTHRKHGTWPDTWIDQRHPNPGPAVVFSLGLPLAVVDRHGATHVVRDLETYNLITEGEAA